MIRLIFFMLALSLVAGCSAIEKVGQKIQDNEFVVRLAVEQGVLRFIEAGDTQAEREHREARVCTVSTTLGDFIEEHSTATVDMLLGEFVTKTDLSRYSEADQRLILALINEVERKLEAKVGEGELSEDTILVLSGLIDGVKQISCGDNYVALLNKQGFGIENYRGYILGETQSVRNITTI